MPAPPARTRMPRTYVSLRAQVFLFQGVCVKPAVSTFPNQLGLNAENRANRHRQRGGGQSRDEWPSSAPDQEAPKPGRSAVWWEARPLPAQRGSRPRIVLVAVVMIGVFSFLMYSVFRDAPREGRQFPLCPHDLSSLQAGTSCTVAWSALRTKIHPTQDSVGYVWALKHKVEKMYSEESAQERMDGKHIPCIKRGSELYFSDGHHTLSALDFSGFWHLAAHVQHATLCHDSLYCSLVRVLRRATEVTIVVLCDLTALSVADFWATMGEKGFAYLYGRPSGPWTSLPEPLTFSALPSLVVFNNHEAPSFKDDPWRALSGASRKISNQKSCKAAASNTKYCMRAYDRVCNAEKGNRSIFFFEYYWAPAALVPPHTPAPLPCRDPCRCVRFRATFGTPRGWTRRCGRRT